MTRPGPFICLLLLIFFLPLLFLWTKNTKTNLGSLAYASTNLSEIKKGPLNRLSDKPGKALDRIITDFSKTQTIHSDDVFQGGRTTPEWHWLLIAARANGWQGQLRGSISGLRNAQEQNYLWQLWRSGQGAPAFNPNGPSRHLERNVERLGGWAQAVDVTKADQLIAIAKHLHVHLHLPYDSEPWHVEALFPFTPPPR